MNIYEQTLYRHLNGISSVALSAGYSVPKPHMEGYCGEAQCVEIR